ncbi:MAG: putative toxin-antitoxin system toxin component, PIN family [bacterium]
MKVVLDTNTLVSAIGWSGPPQKILNACLQGKFEFYISQALLEEFIKVISRPKLKVIAQHPDLPLILSWLYQPVHLVRTHTVISVIKKDPADNRVLECAVEADAEFIISGDKHLLALEEFQGIKILTPAEAARLFL